MMTSTEALRFIAEIMTKIAASGYTEKDEPSMRCYPGSTLN